MSLNYMRMLISSMYCPVKKMTTLQILCFFLCLHIMWVHGEGSSVITVTEGSDAVLPCSPSTKQNLQYALFDWKKDGHQEVFLYSDEKDQYNNGRSGQHEQFKGRVSHFPEQLEFGNASITIRNTKLADSGNYTCEFPHIQHQIFNIELIVEHVFKDRSGDVEGAAPKPFVGILSIMEDRALLKCEVPGAFPNPKVEWTDSDGNTLPAQEPVVSYRGDRYYVTLLITVSKTTNNTFHCVATQEKISHVTDDEIQVPYYEKTSAGVFVGVYFLGVLSTVIVFAFVLTLKYIRKRKAKRCAHDTELPLKPKL